MIKVCLITCYSQPDYIRARTLRTAFGSMKEIELIIIKNTRTGLLRYNQVFWQVVRARITHNPDIYFLTFRGYEMLPFIRLISLGKKLVFDEFVNPVEQVFYEHHRFNPSGVIAKVAWFGYRLWLQTVDVIVSDTSSHAAYSAQLMKLSSSHYQSLIVSSDEQTFTPGKTKHHTDESFKVFYYGLYMLPLQGLDTILAAMRLLKDHNITLYLIGGRDETGNRVARVVSQGARIIYKKRVPYETLADYTRDADLCLAGPFGGTLQAQFVIGGKTYQFMNTGKPVIIGRNHESHIWTDKKDALIVEQADPKALSEAILWAKHHPAQLDAIGRAGKKLYDDALSNKVLVEQLRTLLASERLLKVKTTR